MSGVNLYRATPRTPIHSSQFPSITPPIAPKVYHLAKQQVFSFPSHEKLGMNYFRFLETCLLILINKLYVRVHVTDELDIGYVNQLILEECVYLIYLERFK